MALKRPKARFAAPFSQFTPEMQPEAEGWLWAPNARVFSTKLPDQRASAANNQKGKMYLKEIETRPPQGMMKIAFAKIREADRAVPEILHLYRFKKRATDHLVRFTDEVMRGPSPLSRGIRELIGAFISSRNQCSFCSSAHVAVAAQLLGQELVDEVLRDLETSRLDSAHKELFRYLGKLADNPALVAESDIDRLKELGWSEAAIYDALTVASLFKFYNTWNNGSGVQNMTSADYLHSGTRLITMGYCMDFSLIGIMKVMWVGRKEVTLADLTGLVKIMADRFITGMRWAFGGLPPGLRDLPTAAQKNSVLPALASQPKAQINGSCAGFLQGGRSRQLARDE